MGPVAAAAEAEVDTEEEDEGEEEGHIGQQVIWRGLWRGSFRGSAATEAAVFFAEAPTMEAGGVRSLATEFAASGSKGPCVKNNAPAAAPGAEGQDERIVA